MSFTVTLVTSNPQKAKEIGHALKPHGIIVRRKALDIHEIQADSIEEVIRDKVEKAYAAVKGPVIVDDAGIFFKGYSNFPGVYSRFMFSSLKFDGMFKLIEDGQPAHFASYIAYKKSARSEPQLFSGKCLGTVITTLRGTLKPKMPYDNFFIPKGDTRTFAEMSVEDKQRYDHRSKAVKKFIRYITQQ